MNTNQISNLPIERKQYGFTLIELSMVLVVIGLLIGGVMAGKEVIKQANLRKAMIQLKSVESGVSQFQAKYSQLPGDMANATSFLTDPLVKNGNGDGIIYVAHMGKVPTATAPIEAMQSLVHLSHAGFIPGKYTGVGKVIIPGINAVDIGDQRVIGLGTHEGPHFYRIGNAISMARAWETGSGFWCYAAFNVTDAKMIDRKLDDGVANLGKLIGVDGGWGVDIGACSAVFTKLKGDDYNANPTDKEVCRMFYYLDVDLF